MKKHILLMLMGLAACSSSDDSIETVTVTSEAVAVGGVQRDVQFDASSGPGSETLIYSTGSSIVATLSRDATLDRGEFDGFQDDPNDDYAFRSASASGDSVVTVGAAEGTFPILSVNYERVNDVAVPVSGATTYTGEYLGLITDGVTNDVRSVVTGNMNLAANFGTSMVSGGITGRLVSDVDTLAANGETTTDLTLESTNLDAIGGFSGEASGSTFTTDAGANVYTIMSGRYTGLISGATANETIGGVVITYERSSGSGGPSGLVETGGFIATE